MPEVTQSTHGLRRGVGFPCREQRKLGWEELGSLVGRSPA